jgi:DNA-damage-inducible protein J
MTTVSLRLDDELKKGLDQMCAEMGMSLTTFFTIYAKRALRERRIPFEINAPAPVTDPERLNWNAIREKTLEAERINGTDSGIPLEDFLKETEAMIRETI